VFLLSAVMALNKTQRFSILLLLMMLSTSFFSHATTSPRHGFPQHVQYVLQTIKPNHLNQAQLDNHVRAYYNHWKAQYLISEGQSAQGQPLYRISFGAADASKTVSEGQGYGMVITALMAGYDINAQRIFDGLYHYARLHPSRFDYRLMTWQCWENCASGDSAFDGDADIAYALLMAHRQWGSAGWINYQYAATKVMHGLLESVVGSQSALPLLGDWVNADNARHNQYTPRSSDFMLAHFRAFYRYTGNPAWAQVVKQSQAVIEAVQTRYSPVAGLLPDFIRYKNPAPGDFLEGNHDGDFYFNAARVPLRLGLDVLLHNDSISRKQVRRMSRWLQSSTQGNAGNIKFGYRLNGTPIRDEFSILFAAPFGVAAMTDPGQQHWLNAIYNAVYNRHEDYYEDSITLLSLLVMTGNFWDPSTVQ
jgi:endoglucanase